MRIMHTLLSPVATVALCAAAASPAVAQRTATDYARPAVQLASFANGLAPVRTVAVYRFGNGNSAGLPAQVSIADSAGTLVASFRLANGVSRPMSIAIADNDILLQGATASGLLTLVLYEQNDYVAPGAMIGRWRLGDREGELRGQTTR